MRNFKKGGKVVAFLLLVALCSAGLKYALMPPTYVHYDLKNAIENPHQDLFVGTSRGANDICPAVVEKETGRTTASVCLGQIYPKDEYYFIRQICQKQKPERIIYELDPSYYIVDKTLGIDDPFLYNEMGVSLNKYQYLLNRFSDQDWRATVFPWLLLRQNFRSIVQNVKIKNSEAYKNSDPALVSSESIQYETGGHIRQVREATEKNLDFLPLTWSDEDVKEERVNYLEKIISYCDKEGIELVVMIIPAPASTVEQAPDGYEKSHAYFASLLEKYQVPFYDFNEIDDLQFERSDDKYTDTEGHMYGDSAEEFSQELGRYLREE